MTVQQAAPAALRPPLPKQLQVEVTGACNLRCRMCLVRYRPPLNRVTDSMCLHTFQRLVDAVPGLTEVTLQGLGEPLMAPDLLAMVAYAAGRGISVGFNTNATLLTRRKAEQLLDAGLAWLHISVDGASAETYEAIRDQASFDRVVRHVTGLVELMRQRGVERPELEVVFVAQRSNVAELPDLVRLVAAWGIGRMWVQNISHDFSDTDPAGSYREIRDYARAEALWGEAASAASETFDRARELGERLGVDLRLPKVEAPAGARRAGEPGCDWPWRSAYVTHDGQVQPCCMIMGSDRGVLGDVRTEDFGSVWHGEGYARFRHQLLGDEPPEVCRGCSAYRGVF